MNSELQLQGLLTTSQAAELSGLTPHRIGCLARRGEIAADRVGHTLFVSASSLQSYVQSFQGRGRPLTPQSAFAVLWQLSLFQVDWLSPSQTTRLKQRLLTATAEELCWQCRKRAAHYTFRMPDSFNNLLSSALILSGKSTEDISSFGLTGSQYYVEGYCREEELCDIVEKHHLVEDDQGKVVIHAAAWLPEGQQRVMPVAVSAIDLSQSLDTRERTAGLKKLQELLDAYRNA